MLNSTEIDQKTAYKIECYVLHLETAFGGPRKPQKPPKCSPDTSKTASWPPKTSPRRAQDGSKTAPKCFPMPSGRPQTPQDAPGCPRRTPKKPPRLDLGWIFNRSWEGKWKQVGNKMRSEFKTRTRPP